MRDIKFRCRNTEKKEMNYDPIAYINDGSINSTFEEADREDNIFMAYTGLNDKLGNPIYEGDVVIDRFSNKKTIIKWTPDTYDGDSIYCSGYFTDSYSKDDIEIIGNIYENPELINN